MIKQLTAAFAAAALMTGAANAKTISFADFAAGNEGGIAENSSVDFGDGVSISFRSGDGLLTDGFVTTNDFFPYFDDVAGGKPAGLGVCRELAGAAGNGAPGAVCSDSADDSIDGEGGVSEWVAMLFNGAFDIRELSFRDGDHNLINDSDGLIRFTAFTAGGVINGDVTFAALVAMAAAGDFVGTTSIGFGYLNTVFYIESISDVPIPAALPLLLSGIAGLGFASRKKKKAA